MRGKKFTSQWPQKIKAADPRVFFAHQFICRKKFKQKWQLLTLLQPYNAEKFENFRLRYAGKVSSHRINKVCTM